MMKCMTVAMRCKGVGQSKHRAKSVIQFMDEGYNMRKLLLLRICLRLALNHASERDNLGVCLALYHII